jgi:outer membrane beta-barrel protein
MAHRKHFTPSTLAARLAGPILGMACTLSCVEAQAAEPAAEASSATSAGPAVEPPIVPQVERRDVTPPRIPSNDLELGLFAGTYSMQNFGAHSVRGLRVGYAITEDFFVEGVYAKTQFTDEQFRPMLPGGLFEKPVQDLSYYNLSVGVNVLPGEVFILGRHARPSALYLLGGVGSTKVATQKRQTLHFGAGYRVYVSDWVALQLDARDHIFSLDLLGKRQDTHNLEFTGGLTITF